MSRNDQTDIYKKYLELYDDLRTIVRETEKRITQVDAAPDSFFSENYNFMTKAFLINICIYLESYIKDIVCHKINSINGILARSEIPYNLVKWSIQFPKDLKDADLRFENMKISIKRQDIDSYVSGNPYKTLRLLKRLGFDLEISQERLELIDSIVKKRNQIIHQNSDASDISLSDILRYIEQVLEYMLILDHSLA